MATYTDNYNLRKPLYSEAADIDVINDNMDVIDDIMHSSQISLADAYDLNETYNTGDVVMYELLMYRCLEDNVTGAWDGTKWERTTASACGGGGTAEEVSYDNTNSGLTADNVQEAIDEMQAEIENIPIVEANPVGTATAELGTIGIDDVIYSLAGEKVYGKSSGAIATFADGGDNKPLKSLKVAINPVQASGTPSPSNPLPISGWAGANIERCGINLWDDEWEGGSISDASGQDATNSNYRRSKSYISVKANKKYYFNVPSKYGTTYRFYQYKQNKDYIGIKTVDSDGTFETDNECAFVRFRIATTEEYTNDISINYPSTDTSYHAYNGTTYPITWSDAGTVYGGYIDYERKKLVVNRAEYNITSSRTLTQNGEDIIGLAITSEYRVEVIPQCECYEGIEKGSSSSLGVNQCRFNSNLSYVNFKFSAPKTVDEWKAELENNPIKLILGLATPIEYDLDSPLPDITTLLGNNNIWSDTGEIVECVYQRDLNLAINELFSLLQNQSGTRSLSALNLTKSASTELTKEEITEETKEEEQNEDKR